MLHGVAWGGVWYVWCGMLHGVAWNVARYVVSCVRRWF